MSKNTKLIYRKLNALRLEVHGTIVDDIKITVDDIIHQVTAEREKAAKMVEALEAVRKENYVSPKRMQLIEQALTEYKKQ